MSRYEIRPIADENGTGVVCGTDPADELLFASDDLAEVQRQAPALADFPYGVGILDTATGALDVGFGFGVPSPDFDDSYLRE